MSVFGSASLPTRRARRTPMRAAVLSLVTLTVYGFWWWFDVNRELRRAGQSTDPSHELVAVTLGWVLVVPPFRSVRRTVEAIAAAQRRAGRPVTAEPRLAVELAAFAAGGFVLFVAASSFSGLGVPLFGWITPVFGMLLVAYVQRELDRAGSHGVFVAAQIDA